MPACVKGGYDFVDVRDVADGCLRALLHGKTGECYILSNRRYEIKDVLKMVRQVHGGHRLPVLPVWMAEACVPFIRLDARRRKRRTLDISYRPTFAADGALFFSDYAKPEEFLTALECHISNQSESLERICLHRGQVLSGIPEEMRSAAELIFAHHELHYEAELA